MPFIKLFHILGSNFHQRMPFIPLEIRCTIIFLKYALLFRFNHEKYQLFSLFQKITNKRRRKRYLRRN